MSTSSTSDDETISNSAEEGSGDSYDEFGEDFEAGIEPYQFEPEWPSGEEDLENDVNFNNNQEDQESDKTTNLDWYEL